MSDAAKTVWGVISAVLAAAMAAGFGYVVYNNMAFLPWDISYSYVNAALVGLVVFICVFVVLFKGVHPF